MSEHKNAAGQNWNANEYAKHGRFVANNLGTYIFDALAAQRGEHILDLGCGDGVLTQKIIDVGAHVIAIDADPSMVDSAKAKGIDARMEDARNLPFQTQFDAVFSNAALHWIREADDVLNSIHRSLKSGGRFIAEFGGFGNVAAIRTAIIAELATRRLENQIINRWYFPTVDDYSLKLNQTGFTILKSDLVPVAVQLSTDVEGWITTFTKGVFTGYTQIEQQEALERIVKNLTPILQDEQGRWWADYVRMRIVAIKKP
jgi:SAM-dependent methyltransferase